MTHNLAQKLFACFLLAFVAIALWLTHGWLYRVYLFPRVVALFVIALLLVHIGTLFWRDRKQPTVAVKSAPGKDAAEDERDAQAERKRAIVTMGWLLGFVALIILLGFPIGGTLATLLYLRLTAREKWPVTLITTAVVAAFFGVTAHPKLMGVPYPKGWIVEKLVQTTISSSYAGETVRIIVGFAPDGGSDRSSRALAQYMSKYIPGHPTVIVENMPGADSVVAANYMYSMAPRDGTVVGTINSGLMTQELIGAEGVNFEADQFAWLGSLTNARLVCLINKSTGVRSLTDLMKPRAKLVIAGALGPISQRSYMPKFLKMTGAKLRIASGYLGSGQLNLALEQGEIDMICGTWHAIQTTSGALLESGRYNVFVQDGETRDALLPNTELLKDALKGKTEEYATWLALVRPESVTQPFILPPGVPANRVAIMREAFEKTIKDPGFVAAMSKLGDGFDPATSKEIETVIQQVKATPPERREQLKALLSPE